MSTAVARRRSLPATSDSAARTTIRPELQGLRAIAVGLVVIFHLWPNRLPGGYLGVDVFFVISGYLITAHILRESDRTGTVALAQFWARRARRLLPAAYLVLGVSLVATLVWVPRMLWQQFAREIGAAALYVENWALARDAVDYLAADNTASPAQHYWTLSAEEQFYIVWPLLVLVGLWLSSVLPPRWGARRVRFGVFGVLATTVAVSFVYSLYLTATNPAASYFVTTTRAWEFGAGALLAFVPAIAGHLHLRAAVSWLGLLVLAGCALRMDSETPMPGTAAIWVVAGTSALLWAGHSEVAWSPTRALAWRPAQFVGDISYSIYLWHWPLIVILPYATDGHLGTLDKIAIAVATLMLSWASKVWVEDPIRTGHKLGIRRPRITFALVGVSVGVLVAGCLVGWTVAQRDNEQRVAAAEALMSEHGECFGAASRDRKKADHCPDPELAEVIIPDPAVVEKDHSGYGRCQKYLRGDTFRGCPFGERSKGVPHIAVVGDSHARALMPMIEVLIARGELTAEMFASPSCGWTTVPPSPGNPDKRKQACADLKANFAQHLEDKPNRFDFILTTSRASSQYAASEQERVDGAIEAWQPALDAQIPVVALRDNPDAGRGTDLDPNLCLARVGAAGAEECALSRQTAVEDNFDAAAEAVEQVDGAYHLDMTRWYCDDDICPAVIGGANVYRDSNHVTTTYARTMAPYYLRAFKKLDLL